MASVRTPAFICLLLAAACGSRGSVTFAIRAPAVAALDPLTDPRVSEYLIKRSDGTLIGAASPSGTGGPLPLGALMVADIPTDVELSVMAGTELIGMARIRDVLVKPGVQASYD